MVYGDTNGIAKPEICSLTKSKTCKSKNLMGVLFNCAPKNKILPLVIAGRKMELY